MWMAVCGMCQTCAAFLPESTYLPFWIPERNHPIGWQKWVPCQLHSEVQIDLLKTRPLFRLRGRSIDQRHHHVSMFLSLNRKNPTKTGGCMSKRVHPVSAAPAVTVAPKAHVPPRVPLKPSIEDQEVYGSVFHKLFYTRKPLSCFF